MTHAVTQIQETTPATVAEVDRTTTWWPRLLKSPLKDQAEYDEVSNAVARFSEPAQAPQLMARIAALLTPYYTGDVPNGVRKIEAEDWAEALAEYPEWAIIKACRWWKGADNANRRKKPLEGDIAARARFECGVIKAAEYAMRNFETGSQPFVPQESNIQKPTQKERENIAELLQEVGYAPKRFGGVQ